MLGKTRIPSAFGLSSLATCSPLPVGAWRCTRRSQGSSSLGPSRLPVAVLEGLGVHEPPTRRGDSNGLSQQALGAPWVRGSWCDSPPSGPPHREGGGDHRDRVVRAGVRPRRGCGVRKAVADYEKASGNKIELSIIP